MAYDALVERIIKVPRDQVYAAFYDFGGVGELVPEVVSACQCIGEGVGSQRTVELADDGGSVVERLEVAHNNSVIAYSIIDNKALPLDNYCAVVTLEDTADGGTSVTYGSNWTPHDPDAEDELQDMLAGLYNAIIDGVVAKTAKQSA